MDKLKLLFYLSITAICLSSCGGNANSSESLSTPSTKNSVDVEFEKGKSMVGNWVVKYNTIVDECQLLEATLVDEDGVKEKVQDFQVVSSNPESSSFTLISSIFSAVPYDGSFEEGKLSVMTEMAGDLFGDDDYCTLSEYITYSELEKPKVGTKAVDSKYTHSSQYKISLECKAGYRCTSGLSGIAYKE